MGKRSRAKQSQPVPAATRDRRSLRERIATASEVVERTARERPPAPWDPFPLSELMIFIGLVCLVTGLILQGKTGEIILFAGIGLACLGGLENAIREHFAGYRSHASLLAGIVFILVLILTTLVFELNTPARAAAAFGTGAIVFFALRRTYLARSGGRPF